MLYDVVICHESEDKSGFVRPLAEALRDSHVEVWYDEFSLRVGDSLRQSIERGLAQSRFGIVVLSPNFFAKRWPIRQDRPQRTPEHAPPRVAAVLDYLGAASR